MSFSCRFRYCPTSVLCRSNKAKWARSRVKFVSCYASWQYSVITVIGFLTSRLVFEVKKRMLREERQGKRLNKNSSLAKEEVENFWECGQLGCHTSLAIINMFWWMFTLHFSLWSRQQHHTMNIEDFTIRRDEKDNEC